MEPLVAAVVHFDGPIYSKQLVVVAPCRGETLAGHDMVHALCFDGKRCWVYHAEGWSRLVG